MTLILQAIALLCQIAPSYNGQGIYQVQTAQLDCQQQYILCIDNPKLKGIDPEYRLKVCVMSRKI